MVILSKFEEDKWQEISRSPKSGGYYLNAMQHYSLIVNRGAAGVLGDNIDIKIVSPFEASKKLREIIQYPDSHIFVKDIIFEGVERTQIEFNKLDDDYEIDSLSFSNVANYEQMINVHTFDLDNIDSMREDILSKTKIQSAYIINQESIEPYNLGLQQMRDDKIKSYFSQEGLGLKTYQSDMFNVWLDAERIVS